MARPLAAGGDPVLLPGRRRRIIVVVVGTIATLALLVNAVRRADSSG